MADNIIEKLNELHTELKSAIDRNDTAASERLNTAMDVMEEKVRSLEAAANRPAIGEINEDPEFKSFLDFARGKSTEAEYKALTNTGGTAGSEGGILVPKVIENNLYKTLVDISPMRQIARVISVSTTDYHIPFAITGAASGWVAETATRSATNTPTFTDIKPTFGELYANAQVTQQHLDDSQFDMASFLNDSVSTEFARNEGAAFITGDGTNKPTGFLNGTPVATADATRAFGTLQYVAGGAASTLPTTFDPYNTLVYSLKAGYRAGSVWLTSKAVIGTMRSVKDSTGQYLWQAAVALGQPNTFMGYPVIEAEDMPAVGANAFPVAFGNFNAGYTIADRIGVSTLRDPYSNKPYVSFYTTKRVGGCVVDSAAIKLLKVATS